MKTSDNFRFSVVIPVKNEASNICFVIEELDSVFENTEFLVVVGDSSDPTNEVLENIDRTCLNNKLQVIMQEGVGKAGAVWTGLNKALGGVLMVFDGDRTITAEDAHAVGAQAEEYGGLVIAERFNRREKNAMPLANYFYNSFMAFLFNMIFKQKCGDLFAGCKAFRSEIKDELYLARNFFSERDQWSDLQMLSASCLLDIKISSISVDYKKRVAGKSKVVRLTDGLNLFLFLINCLHFNVRQKIFYKN